MRTRLLFLLGLLLWFGLAGCLSFQRTTGADSQTTSGSDPTKPARIRPRNTDATPSTADEGGKRSRAETDYPTALESARLTQDPLVRSREFGRLLQRWTERDLEAALTYVRQLPLGDDYTEGLLLVLSALGRTNPDRCLALAGELAITREQRAIFSSLFAQWAESSPTAAVLRLPSVRSEEGRENAIRALADEWARKDFAAAFHWAQKRDGVERSQAVESTLDALISIDPLHAIELAQQSLNGAPLDRTLALALQTLTPADPPAAAAIVARLPPGQMQTAAALGVARELAGKNVWAALDWIKSLTDEATQRLTLNTVLELWATNDPAGAGQYVAQMKGADGQRAAAESVGRVLAGGNALNAIAWAKALPPGATQEAALISAASGWAEHDPAGAATWATAQAPGAVQSETLNGALSYWLLRDRDAARNFVNGLTGEIQTQAAAYIAPTLAQADAPAAVQWAQSLSNPPARAAAVAAAFQRWADNDHPAAQAWLTAASLSTELRSLLQKGAADLP